MHQCGDCTACCSDGPPVVDVDKQQFRRCKYVRAPIAHARTLMPRRRVGCSIYPERPLACQAWSCTWLTDPSWPDDLRPDRCGVICDPVLDVVRIGGEDRPAAQLWVLHGHEEPWTLPAIGAVIIALLDKGLAVLFRFPEGSGVVFSREAGQLTLTRSTVADDSVIGHENQRFRRAVRLARDLEL